MTAARDEAEREIHRVLAAYPILVDTDRLDELMEHFTDDAEFVTSAASARGHEEIVAFLAGAAASGSKGIHLPAPAHVVVADDARTATAAQNYHFVADGINVVKRGTYHDLFVRDGQRWRFRRRTVDIHPFEPES